MTNREMINKLPDDDLMRFLDYLGSCPPFKDCGLKPTKIPDQIDCYQCWLNWLQEKAWPQNKRGKGKC